MAKLGPWAPDLPEWGHAGLVTAQNSYYSTAGYKPVKAPSEITAALPATWLGGGAFEGSGGNTALLAATTGGLYAYVAGAWVLKYAGVFTQGWQFAQFGDLVLCETGGAPVKYDLTAGTAALLGGSPPAASMAAIFGDHVMLAGDSSAVKTFTVSAINDAEGWTIGTGGCDEQELPDGGAITGLAGGEYALVFQSDAINIIEPTDPPLYFTRRKIKSGLGCLSPGSIAQHDGKVFFYARQGFHVFAAGEVQSIGLERIDLTFRDAYSISEIQNNMRATIDPERKLAIWSMPDKLWCYNWEDNAWTVVYIPGIIGISTGRTASITLEAIAVTYPSIEDVPVSFDDPIWRGGEPMLLFASLDGKLYTFGASDNLKATFRLTKQEFAPGRVAHVRNASVETDAVTGCTVNIDTSPRLGDAYVRAATSTMRNNGQMPIRASGRYFQPEIVMAEGAVWSFVSALDLEATAGGVL
jgi:hypothetical protein